MILSARSSSTTSRFGVKKGPAQGVNLMERGKVARKSGTAPGAAWFTEARFGMFVHYGLYSVHGRGEWSMFHEKIPKAEYNQLVEKFGAEKFDADALVDLAKRAGAGYVVMGARHHEGFCLWDTKVSSFNSVQLGAKRDLIREYVTACRRAGLRVGIYYSIMNWQFEASHKGPYEDPEGWKAMVDETHEQLRELMTNYGPIDLLWYDGCVVPGSGEDSIRAKFWRTVHLNAMVRRLQPGILINDRAASAEDITTPEQHLTPAPSGRLWECCQTLGTYWGWHHDDVLKEADELIKQLVFCARFGGNYLLNVGPRADGEVPLEQVARMEAIGRWLAANGEAIRGSERTPYTEAEHILGPATIRGNRVYFHVSNWPGTSTRIAGVKTPVRSAKFLATGDSITFQQSRDGTITLQGLPEKGLDPSVTVLAFELTKPLHRRRPPSLLIERDTGRFDPEEEEVREVKGWDWGTTQCLSFNAPAAGRYHLELGVIGKKPTLFSASIDGDKTRVALRLTCGDYPDTVRLQNIQLSEGRHDLVLRSEDGILFGLYLWRLQPNWRTLGAQHWRMMGPFPTTYTSQGTDDDVREAMHTVFPPEWAEYSGEAVYHGGGQTKVSWQRHGGRKPTINFARLCDGKDIGVCYARTTIFSRQERAVEILVACDWWANVLVNRSVVASLRDVQAWESDGAWFNGWKPIPARISLRKGENEVLVKCHPGSTNNWFTFFLNDPGDLQVNR